MAELKVLTRDVGRSGVVPTAGSQVTVDGKKIDRVQSVALEAEPLGLWTLTIKVQVDPNTLFGVLPPNEPLAMR